MFERIVFVQPLERAVGVKGFPLISQIAFPFSLEAIDQRVAAENQALDSVKFTKEITDPVLPKQFADDTFGMSSMIIELPGGVINFAGSYSVHNKIPITGKPHFLE